MSPQKPLSQKLLLDRLEFTTIKVVSATKKFSSWNKDFPQLDFDFSKVNFLTRSALHYSPEEAADPRHFALSYGLKIEEDEGSKDIPYQIEVEARGFFRYVGDAEFQGADRFRAVRFSGYQILYGAMREMVCNLTARASHGLLQLPARNFGLVAKERAEKDEADRLELLSNTALTQKNKSTALKSESSKVKTKTPRIRKKGSDRANE